MKESASLRRQARLLVLLQGAARAGLEPIGIIPLHAYAYLANVLAPVWDMPVLEGKILKRRGGPFYPSLQRDLDLMVGRGMVRVSDISHVRDVDGKWRLEGRFSLNRALSSVALEFLLQFPEEADFATFASELAIALSALSDTELELALVEDATYSDPGIGARNVVDFGEWTNRNPSLKAANYFSRLAPRASSITPGEKLHLYVRHIHQRFHVG